MSEDSQKLHKIGIGDGVEDDEAGVDGKLSSSDLRGDRIRMAAYAPRLFVDRHVVARMQEPGGGETGNAGPDNGDFQSGG